ncbi:hypothetical protein [Planosporangium mesophilum]|uniref:Uncharacterized protein n=1 Tax=Planosporangium mesophilum TaxID=689768 RepID=A0A8J3T9Z7_9ACTN|nr:hypothetical protein [Planosporangium mesophilum]NJC83176.1 hypothetical protein [Planosporangium mesophilum]GII22598.1 hypothetical protein Pme01_21950 [Planosporangium mesophilum]
MLHENVQMLDMDVNHWRNLQNLVLESAKEKRRIIVIHEDGEIVKFVHSQRLPIVKSIDRVDDPHAAAEHVYRANRHLVDFVAVFEREAFDRYFGHWQGTWRADEDLDEFAHRTYATLDEYADGLVTYPGPARSTLGLQWRVGASYAEVKAAVERYVPADTAVVFGVFDGDELWASLVLGFDADRRAHVVTTVDTFDLTLHGSRRDVVRDVIAWADRTYGPCSIGLFTGLDGARALLGSREKVAVLRVLAARGNLILDPAPAELASLVSF